MTFCEKTEIAKFAKFLPSNKITITLFFWHLTSTTYCSSFILYSFNNHHQVPKYFNFTAKFHRFEPVDFQLRVPVHEIFFERTYWVTFYEPTGLYIANITDFREQQVYSKKFILEIDDIWNFERKNLPREKPPDFLSLKVDWIDT